MNYFTTLQRSYGRIYKYILNSTPLLILIAFIPISIKFLVFVHAQFPFGTDIDAIICASEKMKAGLTPYSSTSCPNLSAAPFVYPPQVALFGAFLLQFLGPMTLRLGYLVLLWIPACLYMTWLLLFDRIDGAFYRYRIVIFSGLLGVIYYSGNIGLIFHYIIFLLLLQYVRSNVIWPFIACILVASLVKITLASYLIVVLIIEKDTFANRIRTFALSAAVMTLVLTLEWFSAGPMANEWVAAVKATAVTSQTGFGLFGFLKMVHIELGSAIAKIIWIGYAGTIAICGAVASRKVPMDLKSNVLFAAGVSQMLNPRILDYDLMAFVPMAAIGISRIVALLKPKAKIWFEGVIIGSFSLSYGLSFFDLKVFTHVMTFREKILLLNCFLSVIGLAVIASLISRKRGLRNRDEISI